MSLWPFGDVCQLHRPRAALVLRSAAAHQGGLVNGPTLQQLTAHVWPRRSARRSDGKGRTPAGGGQPLATCRKIFCCASNPSKGSGCVAACQRCRARLLRNVRVGSDAQGGRNLLSPCAPAAGALAASD